MKEKYGSDVDEDEAEEDSEEAESEDEDGEELTPAVDAAILRTLARIKRKDPSIYEQGKDVFEGQNYLRAYSNAVLTLFDIEEITKVGDVSIALKTKTKEKVRIYPWVCLSVNLYYLTFY